MDFGQAWLEDYQPAGGRVIRAESGLIRFHYEALSVDWIRCQSPNPVPRYATTSTPLYTA